MAERVPRLVANVDMRKLKLDPTDGFLLTRINGRLGKEALSGETGIPVFSIERAIDKLQKLGVIELVDPNAAPPPPPPPPPPPAVAAAAPPAAPPSAPGDKPPPPAPDKARNYSFGSLAVHYDPAELDEECDLPREQRKRILDTFYRLEDLDHFTLLGVTTEADKKTIKRAYFELASVFHPDRFFQKKLGSFKAKTEAVFGRITEAHDTLTKNDARKEYETYLAEVATTRGMEAMFERALEETRKAAETAASAPPPEPAQPPPTPDGQLMRVVLSAAEVQTRKDALARRLLGGGASLRPQKPAVSAPPNPLAFQSTGDAMDALKRRYHSQIENATAAQAQKYLVAADKAAADNDIAAAASALSIATKFSPDDEALAARYKEMKAKADRLLCDSYAKQAAYEERSMHWAEAARNWHKVAQTRVTDAKAHERAANAMLKSDDGNMQQASEHAKAAVALEPSNVAAHVTLVEVYLKAGLMASARSAITTGLQQDPSNTALLAAAKRAK